MRRIIMILLVLLLIHIILVGKTVPFQALGKPNLITVVKNQIYIAEGATVSIIHIPLFRPVDIENILRVANMAS